MTEEIESESGIVRFIVAGTQRTGTSLINQSIRSHPNIVSFSEVFLFRQRRGLLYKSMGKNMEGSYRQYLDEDCYTRHLSHIFSRRQIVYKYLDQLYRQESADAVGFKFMIDQAKQFPEVVSYIQEKKIKVLHVIRENLLKTLVSRTAAKTRNMYHTADEVEVNKVVIPTSRLIDSLDRIQREIDGWKELSYNTPYLPVTYESFTREREPEVLRILDFLEVSSVENLTSSLQKINPDNLSEVILNFEEVKRVLSGTKHEIWLSL